MTNGKMPPMPPMQAHPVAQPVLIPQMRFGETIIFLQYLKAIDFSNPEQVIALLTDGQSITLNKTDSYEWLAANGLTKVSTA